MVKMTKKFNFHRLNHLIDQIKQKIQYNESYLLVIQEKQLKNRIKKVNELKKKNQVQIFEIWKKTLTPEAYTEIFSKKEIEKLDRSFYWKKRASTHLFHKKVKADKSLYEDIKEQYENDLAKLNKIYLSKKASILSKHALGTNSDYIIKGNQELLRKEEKRLNEELKAFEAQLILDDQEKYNLESAKIDEKNLLLSAKLEELEIKKASLLSGMTTHEMPDDVILRLTGLRMQFGGLVAVDNLTFDVKKGEVFGLIGPNGAGKTTVFNCITQFYKPTAGQMLYRDKNHDIVDLNDFAVHDVIKHGIVRTFQNVELIWELSILDNLLIASHTQYQSNFFGHLIHSTRFKKEEEILKAKALKILTDLGLLGYKDFYPIGLPYGVLKLVELARTLMTNPKLIILDEPAAGLNDLESEKLVSTIRKIQKEYDCTIFLVEHDMGLVMKLCDTICAISFGKKLAIGTPKEIQANKIVQEAYLGGE
ncbi:MAG: ABC transporter ATP-binding protein [Acholeplasmataceae bacterium]|nr:ABC transporter ATP-binding protein [Acholeplasmataceae bacterium]